MAGNPSLENNGIPFRLADDLQIVSYQKTMYPVCERLRKFAVDNGVAEVAIENHLVRQRFHPVPWHQNFMEWVDNKLG